MHEILLGWDVGGTSSAVIVGDASGAILRRIPCDTPVAAGPVPMIEEFIRRARPLTSEFTIRRGAVSIGGPLNSLTGVILAPPHLPGWIDIPLKAQLEKSLEIPFCVEHDAAACLRAEMLWGAAQNFTHAIYLTMGTGCGAGIAIDGKILRGPDGQSPEIGHWRLADDGPEAFGVRGCVESFCSGSGMAKYARWKYPAQFAPTITAEQLSTQAPALPDAAEVIAHAARMTGRLCAMLSDAFSPQVILLGSLAHYLGEPYLENIRTAFHAEALAFNARHTRILPAALGERLQDLSAIAPAADI